VATVNANFGNPGCYADDLSNFENIIENGGARENSASH